MLCLDSSRGSKYNWAVSLYPTSKPKRDGGNYLNLNANHSLLLLKMINLVMRVIRMANQSLTRVIKKDMLALVVLMIKALSNQFKTKEKDKEVDLWKLISWPLWLQLLCQNKLWQSQTLMKPRETKWWKLILRWVNSCNLWSSRIRRKYFYYKYPRIQKLVMLLLGCCLKESIIVYILMI